jgi:T4-like virus tail tube protein gp19
MAGTRTDVAGSFMLNLDGVPCGFVRSVDGGGAVGEVVVEKLQDGSAKKHIAGPKYEEIEMSIGFGLAQDVYEWIAASWKMDYSRKDGSIVVADTGLQAKTAREFFHALVTDVTFPDLDASSKAPAFLTVKFAPEYTRDTKPSGKLNVGKTPAQKQFLASNFRFELGELPCAKVSKIDSFTVTQTFPADEVGDGRGAPKDPAKLDFPNLRVTILKEDAGAWSDWHEDFVVKGNSADENEKSGVIYFLAPNRQAELGRLTLYNVGIFALRGTLAAAADQVAHVVADLYCERMELRVTKS